MGDDNDSIASVAVMSLSERQSRVKTSRESLDKRLAEYILPFFLLLFLKIQSSMFIWPRLHVRKVDRWKSEKEVDVLAELDNEFSEIEHVVKTLVEQDILLWLFLYFFY